MWGRHGRRIELPRGAGGVYDADGLTGRMDLIIRLYDDKHTCITKEADMPISKLGQRRQVVIPKATCDELGLQEGDFVEVMLAEGHMVIKPQRPTLAQRAVIDTRLAEAEEDLQAGRVNGPFATVDELKRHLDAPR